MHWLLYPLALLAALFGVLMMAVASSALHEIQAFICFLGAAILAGSGAVVQAVHRLRRAVLDQAPVDQRAQG